MRWGWTVPTNQEARYASLFSLNGLSHEVPQFLLSRSAEAEPRTVRSATRLDEVFPAPRVLKLPCVFGTATPGSSLVGESGYVKKTDGMSRSNRSNSPCPDENVTYVEVRQALAELAGHLRKSGEVDASRIDSFSTNMSRRLNALMRCSLVNNQDSPTPRTHEPLDDSLLQLFEHDMQSSLQDLLGDRYVVTFRSRKR